MGDFTPIVITAGTLQNQGDLLVTSDHRFFMYERGADHHAARMVQAKDLVNGTTIYPAHLGHMDYVQILFEDHQIIFAEGIALENMRITPQSLYLIPDDKNGAVAFHQSP